MATERAPLSGEALAQVEREERLGSRIRGAQPVDPRRHAMAMRLLGHRRAAVVRDDATSPREALDACVDDELHERVGNEL